MNEQKVKISVISGPLEVVISHTNNHREAGSVFRTREIVRVEITTIGLTRGEQTSEIGSIISAFIYIYIYIYIFLFILLVSSEEIVSIYSIAFILLLFLS